MYVGNELYAEDRYEEAMRIFELEAEEFPQFGYMYLMMARVHAKQGDMQSAMESYEECLKRQPELADESFEKFR